MPRRKKIKEPEKGKPEGRSFEPQDIEAGEIICFYAQGWRYAVVDRVYVPKRKTAKAKPSIHTDRYGKVPISKVREVWVYNKDGKTAKKDYANSFEGFFE